MPSRYINTLKLRFLWTAKREGIVILHRTLDQSEITYGKDLLTRPILCGVCDMQLLSNIFLLSMPKAKENTPLTFFTFFRGVC